MRVLASLSILASCGDGAPTEEEPTTPERPDRPEKPEDTDTEIEDTDTTDPGLGDLLVTMLEADSWLELGETATFTARVAGTEGQTVDLVWSSSEDGVLGTASQLGDGDTTFTTDALTQNWHTVSLKATTVEATGRAEAVIGICDWPPFEDFEDGIPQGWTVYGDAYHDPQGWLEITGNIQDRKGAIFRTSKKVAAGNVTIEFDISTGDGINSGADGYAVSVINADDVARLSMVVAGAEAGGCLGYGYAPPCANNHETGFHIEFDTWQNNEFNDIDGNHVAITLDGNPGDHKFAASIPSLEDGFWRHVEVQIEDSTIRVRIDGEPVISGLIPGFQFEGGYIGVSGSTGWATNYHRFDNLQLWDACVVTP